MKKLDEVFDLVKLQAWIDQAHRDLTRATGDEYLDEEGESRSTFSTIVPESDGWHQPSSVCDVFGITPEDLSPEVIYKLDAYDNEVFYRNLYEERWVSAEEYIDTLEYNYEQIEQMVDKEYTEPIREKLELHGGHFALGWFNGEFEMMYWIDIPKHCPLGGDTANDCADCVYRTDFHFVDGECARLEEGEE